MLLLQLNKLICPSTHCYIFSTKIAPKNAKTNTTVFGAPQLWIKMNLERVNFYFLFHYQVKQQQTHINEISILYVCRSYMLTVGKTPKHAPKRIENGHQKLWCIYANSAGLRVTHVLEGRMKSKSPENAKFIRCKFMEIIPKSHF